MEDDVTKKLDEELARRCRSWKYLLAVFLLTTTPGLYNALHITVYVFMTRPVHHTCLAVQPLFEANFTFEQVLNISSPSGDECQVYEWDYEKLAILGYEEAVRYTSNMQPPPAGSCPGRRLYPPDQPNNVIQQWDLVCERSALVSLVQVAVAFGKFVGAFCFGIVADKFGRKRCFLVASAMYVVAGPLAAWVDDFTLFLCLRFVLGLAGSAVYETGYVLLSELTTGRWRSRLSCVYGIFYPVGMVLLPLIALNFTSWRLLQLSISLPTFFILLNCWLLPESPRWLLVKGRTKEAWKILVGKEAALNIELESARLRSSAEPILAKQNNTDGLEVERHAWYKKCMVMVKEVFQIFTNSELRRRALICNFSWFIASLGYYVIALNGVNLTSNLYAYIALNGVFEAPGYLLPVLLITWLGRRAASVLSFFVTGASLLLILAIPSGLEGLRTVWAMMGRLWVSSVFSFITLHTSELFPTSNRNTAIGMTLTMSQIGSMSAPLLVQMGSLAWFVPSTVCGVLALVAGGLVLLLPETRDEPLSDTVHDLDRSKRVSFANCCSRSRRVTESS